MIRYRRLGYLALNVVDPQRSARFYTDRVGLQPVAAPVAAPDRGLRYLRCSDKHHDLVLYPSPRPGLKRIGFELESEASLAPLRAALDLAGVPWTEIPATDAAAMRTVGGIRSFEPVTRCTLDFYAAMQPSDAPAFEPTVAKIQRLGHVVLRSAEHRKTVEFFEQVLNFRVSDSIDDAVTFMRCFPNPFHHSLGVGNGKGRSGLHHVNFMVSDVDDIGRAIWRLTNASVPIVNGPGRHLPSGSMFLYYLDPDGLTIEYSFGMEEFPEQGARAPRTLPPVRESFDLWGAPVDPRKSAVGDIEPAELAATH
ncbi:MAG TPA: VOC family protein [Burkholderiaceae bacterium]|jgi:2,3-dihydroxy-p-cumate/2,3-dihydroxybenzoate 3,4-dioxygenase|nr:VOC family protein [Burkholderiaceae bacterium]